MFVWAYGRQAAETSFELALAPADRPARLPAHWPAAARKAGSGFRYDGVNKENPTGVQGVSSASQGTLQNKYGTAAGRGRRPYAAVRCVGQLPAAPRGLTNRSASYSG